MKKPALPIDEKSRLKTLHSLDILDTPAEERFDRLTRLAQRMFETPIALVSLVDENRQWFKSCIGLDVRETPRDISLCGHAILDEDVFMVPDATKDERFADNPLVLDGPKLRFYAGCPMKYMDGSKLGTLCIIDTKPRELSKKDLGLLKDLTELAESELAAIQLAKFDELTKILNRRGFISLAQNSLNLCARKNIPTSIVFFDLNGFKKINDDFGHTEGDTALTVFAKHMTETFRESDVFARLGGDEFIALLTDSTYETANDIVLRLRKSLDEYNRGMHHRYEILFSAGVVMVNYKKNYSIEVLLSKADAVMYEKKHGQSKSNYR
jgi:diguanylate cyclase (GGDEF)-like protein